MKSICRGFIYEYETPKIVTIHSISIALTCRLIQLLILCYGVAYLMVYKKGYQEMDTSIISSITLKVKGIGYNRTGPNETLVVDGADYIIPPQENNALFLMTNFIRTDQKHSQCPETIDMKQAACFNDTQCRKKDFLKANGRWTGRCVEKKRSTLNTSQSIIGQCEIEGWCPVENDTDVPEPIRDALNFTIFIKNFIEFPRFKVIRKNIEQSPTYLKTCSFHSVKDPICPIFRVGTILDDVEDNKTEITQMLKFGGVIRVKIDWKCNLDKPLHECQPKYSFGRLDVPFKEDSFSKGFNFRFASHWKHQNESFRTLTKAFGLRFIISVSGQAGRFDIITLSLNIGSLIGILGLATVLCDIVALYVHGQSEVYRQQKFQDVDLNLLRLETLNSLAEGMVGEVAKRKNGRSSSAEQSISNKTIGNYETKPTGDSPIKDTFQRLKEHRHRRLYENIVSSSPQSMNHVPVSSNHYQQRATNPTQISTEDSTSLTSVKQRRSMPSRPSQMTSLTHDSRDKVDMIYADEDSPISNDKSHQNIHKKSNSIGNDQLNRPSPKIETFL
ncbi:unnamed protein product [Adineta ricciae]|uniref:P2X purinoceptor n=1 Tax=Adineta ricciae TaxID=249248 RepID=A0A815GXD9_ADIRI|nr:unnamed protein product [Adineta ricciae]